MLNEHKIDKITIYRNAHTKCKLGDDWYTTEVTITMFPDKEIPDYRDVDKHFATNIDGQHMTIEDVISSVIEFIMKDYQPYSVTIDALVQDSNHPKVIVSRTDKKNI